MSDFSADNKQTLKSDFSADNKSDFSADNKQNLRTALQYRQQEDLNDFASVAPSRS